MIFNSPTLSLSDVRAKSIMLSDLTKVGVVTHWCRPKEVKQSIKDWWRGGYFAFHTFSDCHCKRGKLKSPRISTSLPGQKLRRKSKRALLAVGLLDGGR